MPRYLLKINARDKETGRLRRLWCVFSTVVMSCISPIVEAESVEEAKRLLRKFKLMGISDLRKEAIRRGFLTEEEAESFEKIMEAIRAEPGMADKLVSENRDLISKYSSAIDKVEEILGVEGYNDKYIEEIRGEIEDNKVTAWMEVYEYKLPKTE